MPEQSRGGAFKKKLRTTAKLLAGLAVLASGVVGTMSALSLTAKAATLRAYTVAGNSMAPTFEMGDRVCAETQIDAWPMRGEVWVFRFPKASNMSGVGIKRVMGLPGDELEVRNGRLIVNGKELSEPYLTLPFTYSQPPLTLGPNQLYVLGDDRDGSSDGHIWGVLPRDHLIGKVRYRLWPLSKLGEIE